MDSSGCRVAFSWVELPHPSHSGLKIFRGFTINSRWSFPVALRVGGIYGAEFSVAVAHWFLMLLFLVVWSAWLFFHWKREQKKLA